MTEVIINNDESFEKALKRFKKKCERAGILSDLRKHRHFEKPSERRRRKMPVIPDLLQGAFAVDLLLQPPQSSFNRLAFLQPNLGQT